MTEPEREPFTPRPVKEQPFSLSVRTDEDYAEGDWRTLPCGLEVLVAPSGTSRADSILAKLVKKHGDTPKKSIDDIPPQKQRDFTVDLLAAANFLAFRDPKTKRPEVEINGEVWHGDQIQDRKRVLSELPTVRLELEALFKEVQAEFGSEIEEAEKN